MFKSAIIILLAILTHDAIAQLPKMIKMSREKGEVKSLKGTTNKTTKHYSAEIQSQLAEQQFTKFVVNEAEYIESVTTGQGTNIVINNFEDDFYKYHIDRLVGKIVKRQVAPGTAKVTWIVLDELKKDDSVLEIEDIVSGDVRAEIYDEKACRNGGLSTYLNLKTVTSYRLQFMARDIKSCALEEAMLDAPRLAAWFESHKSDLKDYFFVDGVILREITYKQFISIDDELKAGFGIVDGKMTFSATDDKYSLKLKLVPNVVPIIALESLIVSQR